MDIFSIFFVFILEKLDSMNTHVVDIEKVQNTIKDIYAGLESIETFLEDIYSSIKLYQYPYEINDFKKFEKIIQDFSGNKNFHLGNDNFFGMKYFKSSTLEVIINEVEENSASIIDITDIVTNHSNSQPISHKPMSNVR